ncbi:MAG: hypothetical protein AAFR96_08735 [Planctomycetota bacterium]
MDRRRGIALVEAVLSVALVGGLLVASIALLSSTLAESRVGSDRSFGRSLASGLVEEISLLPVVAEDLRSASAIEEATNEIAKELGVTAEELVTTRLLFDEVVDYAGYTSAPPRFADGTPIPGTDGWTRSVEITEVSPAYIEGEAAADTGVYRVRVEATKAGRIAGEIIFYRSLAGDEAMR